MFKLTCGVEFKASASGIFEGYGSIFGNMDKGGDVVQRGAFTKSLDRARQAGRMPKMLLHHDTTLLPGVWLEIREDVQGLWVKGQLLITTALGRETYEQMKAGALDGLSIGYQIFPNGTSFDKASGARLLTDLDLWEVSIVVFPMNEESRISAVKAETARRPVAADLRRLHLAQEHARWL